MASKYEAPDVLNVGPIATVVLGCKDDTPEDPDPPGGELHPPCSPLDFD